jgi:membrane-bound serine protease (ClpP class)
MELLLNPDLGYLLLMGGILFALLALLTPGTGILELGAVIVLALVAIQLFNLPINLWALGFILVGGLVYVLAVLRRGEPRILAASLLLILPGAALIYRGEEQLFGVNIWLVLIVSAAEGSVLWVITRKVVNAFISPPAQALENLIGSQGESRTYVHDDGTVYVAGEEWSARSEVPIAPNQNVRIVGREGFTLIVEAIPSTTPQPAESGTGNNSDQLQEADL